ncbi:DUF4124 domain-containing protein [Marinobacter sp.]|uniref:DUF4124 domain-containing protein n=1 Tax=Marinobacter sp. TaxID=50741 RepID=UPI001B4E51A3|nr:DUF4124 domain-containing protein [Marinobacter sp.]MBQ0833197.1 DUF4124 domain-containing protein [Marinobacter sp.]
MLLFRRLMAGSLLAVLSWSVASAEVYKWLDESGNIHFGDRVPEKYRQAGEAVDVQMRRPTAADRQKAEALAESIRQAADSVQERRLEEIESIKEGPEQSGQVSASQKATNYSPPNTLRPGQARLTRKQRMENYEAAMARYKESQRCFAPYQKLGGGTRGYAFNHCETVERPIHPDVR